MGRILARGGDRLFALSAAFTPLPWIPTRKNGPPRCVGIRVMPGSINKVPHYSVWVRNYSVKFKCPATR